MTEPTWPAIFEDVEIGECEICGDWHEVRAVLDPIIAAELPGEDMSFNRQPMCFPCYTGLLHAIK